jgi:hypothetical protein
MEELIYLAVAVGWMIFNAFKKSQAQKPKEIPGQQRRQAPQEPEAEAPMTIDDMMRQLMGEEPREKVRPLAQAPKAVPVAAPVHVHKPLQPVTPRVSRLTPRTSTRRDPAVKRELNEPMRPIEVEVLADDRFDLRNAIRYNAILQRPYA